MSIPGDLVDLNRFQTDKQYSVAHCSHVIEHLSQPMDFLRGSNKALIDGGVLLLSFPAYEPALLFSVTACIDWV